MLNFSIVGIKYTSVVTVYLVKSPDSFQVYAGFAFSGTTGTLWTNFGCLGDGSDADGIAIFDAVAGRGA